MESFHEKMIEYKKQLQKGAIQGAYRGLMNYFSSLKSHFKKKYPEFDVSGSTYFGYMDMTYFPIFTKALKTRKLKIAIVFLHKEFRFEAWLSAANKTVQKEYWEFVKESGWDKYEIPTTLDGVDSIIEYILVDNPDFSNLDILTNLIEIRTIEFKEDVEDFLS